jgi:hypothetical protein
MKSQDIYTNNIIKREQIKQKLIKDREQVNHMLHSPIEIERQSTGQYPKFVQEKKKAKIVSAI